MINKEKNNIPVAIFALFLTAFLWGLAFVFQSVGMKTIGPNTFNAMRFLVGGIFLIPVYFFMNHKKLTSNIKSNFICNLKGGLTLGLILFFAAMTQQISLLYTSVAKVGFITVLYIVLVPIIHFFLGDKISKKILFCILLSILGLYFLTIKESFNISYGDLLALISALIYAYHIIYIDKCTKNCDSILLTMLQFLLAGVLSLIVAFIIERPGLRDILYAYRAIIYTGIFSSGIGYTLQVFAQKHLNPTLAALIMSLESVFAAIAAYFILAQNMSIKEIVGCIFVLAATIFAQLPDKKL